MTAIVKPAVTQDDLNRWYLLQEQLAKVKEEEMELRKKIFGSFFPAPKEGTNKQDLTDGWVIKGTHVITRKVDLPTWTNMQAILKEKGLPVDNLIKNVPELVTGVYRTLTAEQRLLFDEVLIIKEGSPSLEIVKPKR